MGQLIKNLGIMAGFGCDLCWGWLRGDAPCPEDTKGNSGVLAAPKHLDGRRCFGCPPLSLPLTPRVGSSNISRGISLKFPGFFAAQPHLQSKPEPQAGNPSNTVGYKRWTSQDQGEVGSAAGVLSSPQLPGKKEQNTFKSQMHLLEY